MRNLWLDDIRDPAKFGRPDWIWAKTAAQAIELLRIGATSGGIAFASLDHDLTEEQMLLGGYNERIHDDGVKSGYDVVLWLEQNPAYWPTRMTYVHSANPAGRARMLQVIERHYQQK